MDENQNEFTPFLYSFFKGFDTFKTSMKDYKDCAENEQYSNKIGMKDIIEEFYKNNNESLENAVDKFLPEKYRPVAKMILNWPWPTTIDLASSMIKEYGKSESGGYKSTGDVLRKFAFQKMKEKIFS